MKIRNKITLWITGAGVLASLVFSVIVFEEMKEQPFRLIDGELETIAQVVVSLPRFAPRPPANPAGDDLPFDAQKYWIKIYDQRMQVVYQSRLCRYADLPLHNKGKGYTVRTTVAKEQVDLDPDAPNEVTFRVKALRFQKQGATYIVQIGKPIEKLDEEILDLIQGIAAGLAAATMLLVGISYVIAGKILKPISTINRLAKDINDQTLNRRIPLGKNHDELFRLSESLNRMFDRLQEAFDRQKQFIADASHELKSPITLLLLSLEEAVQRPDLPDGLRQQLIRQTDIMRRMSRLVKNLLDLSALEMQETISTDGFDLAGLVRSILEDYEDVFAARKIEVAGDMPQKLPMRGDPEKLQRMLINLVDNAVKYNHEGGSIRISASGKNRDIELSLSNTGGGIPPEDLVHVFEKFYRVEKSRSPQFGGAGLGLTIVKRIVELHNGRIRIKSEPDGWTRIDIVFPGLSRD
ncbi:MAG: ATP-binding protein [Desulfobacterales bacterium]